LCHVEQRSLIVRILGLLRNADRLSCILPVLYNASHIQSPRRRNRKISIGKVNVGSEREVPSRRSPMLESSSDGTVAVCETLAMRVCGGHPHGQGTMHTPEEYRKYAEECERIARGVSPENRRILLNIAHPWRERADDAEEKIKDSPSSVDGD
jgi:hypothetical protein